MPELLIIRITDYINFIENPVTPVMITVLGQSITYPTLNIQPLPSLPDIKTFAGHFIDYLAATDGARLIVESYRILHMEITLLTG